MRIDSHQHFWKYNPVRDSWIDDTMSIIKRDFLPDDLKPVLEKNNIDGTIAVQADQSENETVFLLDLAVKNPFIKGVVGWLDLKSDIIEDKLARYSGNKKFIGVRHIVQAEPRGFLEDKSFISAVKLLSKYDLTYDLLIYHNQFDELLTFVGKISNQSFVLDHIGKPAIGLGNKSIEFERWAKNIRRLAEYPNVYCKISGMVTETAFNQWKYEDFLPFLDVVTEAFGINRIMFGSDWPVCLLSGGYEKVLSIVENYYKEFSEYEINRLMGGNAVDFYKI